MPENTTPPRKTVEDILESSLQGLILSPTFQDLIQSKAEITLGTTPNHHKKLRAEDPYTKNHAIGENHVHVAPKRYLMENMAEYARQGYKILFVEHLLHDEHQADLDAFHVSGTLSPTLCEYLSRQNNGQMQENYNDTYNYTAVLEAAQAHGVRVIALDTSLSYSFRRGKQRALAFSLTASEIISRHAHTDKWVALMGSGHNHLQRFDDGTFVPGIANLLPNTASINVFDKNPDDDTPPLTAQRNVEKQIDEKFVYADIGITVDRTHPLQLNLALIPALKSPEKPLLEKIWEDRAENAQLGDISPTQATSRTLF